MAHRGLPCVGGRGARVSARCLRVVALSALLATLPAVPASAHVDVLPFEAAALEAQQFTVRVPSERPLPTVGVRVIFPPQVAVYSFRPPPLGWRLRVLRAPDGRSRGVEYRGGRIGAGRYQDFAFLGTPQRAGTALWRAEQIYADGKVKPWTGPPEPPGAVSRESGPTSVGPGSALTIRSAGSGDPAAVTESGGGGGGSKDGLWLGAIAIALALAAGLGTARLWATRPRMPPLHGEAAAAEAGARAPTRRPRDPG